MVKMDSYVHATLFVYDAIGNQVIMKELNEQSNVVNVSSFPRGLYLFCIIQNGEQHQLKFIKN